MSNEREKEDKLDNNEIEQELEREIEAAEAEADQPLAVATDSDAEKPEQNEKQPSDSSAHSRPGTVWPWVVAVIAVAALAFVLIRDSSGGSGMNEAVGKLDGVKITKADFYDSLIKQMGPDSASSMLDQVMTLKLLELEAGKAGKVVSDADIDAEIKEVKKDYPTDEVFEQMLASQQMTLDSIREQVKTQLELRAIFDKKLNPKEEDLKKFFEENKDRFSHEEQIRASHILFANKADAEAALKELQGGADFAKLAAEKSTDTATKDSGGDLNWFGRGMMNEPFETAAFKLEKDQISGVVESPDGFHIIKLTGKWAAYSPVYDEIKQAVRNRYIDENLQSQVPDWLENAKKERKYENLLQAKPTESPAASADASPTASASAKE